MVRTLDTRQLIAFEFLLRKQLKAADVWKQQHTLGTDEDGTLIRQRLTFQQGNDFLGRFGRAIIPGDVDAFTFRHGRAREGIDDFAVDRPVPCVRRRAFGSDGNRGVELEALKNRIEDVAAHVTKCAGAEVEAHAPVFRMIVSAADERTLGADAEPQVPVKTLRHGIGLVRPGRRVAPCLGRPCVDVLDFTDRAVLDDLCGHPIINRGMDLDAHLRDDLLFLGQFGHAADLIQAVGERFLAIEVFAQLHGADAHGCVHVIGGGDVHAVDVACLLVEHLAPVLIEARLGKFRAGRSCLGEIHIAERHNLDVLAVRDMREVGLGHAAQTEAGVADCLGRGLRHQVAGDERGTCRGGAQELEQRTA